MCDQFHRSRRRIRDNGREVPAHRFEEGVRHAFEPGRQDENGDAFVENGRIRDVALPDDPGGRDFESLRVAF